MSAAFCAAYPGRYAFKIMEYNLNNIIELCSEHGFNVKRPDENRVDIQIHDDCVLSFLNLVD